VVATILRRDGRRPLKLRAALLARWRQSDPASGAWFELALHLADDGSVAAALSLTAAEGDRLRPLHVAATLHEPGALDALVRGFDAAAACAAGDATDPAAVAASVETARALRDAHARFTAWARRSGALMEQD
jgi:precorrin-6x reductase